MAALRPYDIQPGESARAYEAFAIYRDMGAERSIDKAAQSLTKSSRVLKDWSTRHAWAERVRAFDEEVARRSTVASVDAHAEAKARHAALGVAMQKWGRAVIDSTPAAEAKAADGIAAARGGVKIEREARDIPTKVEVDVPGKIEVIVRREDRPIRGSD